MYVATLTAWSTVANIWDKHWVEIVFALVFAAIVDSLHVGSLLRSGVRHINNKLAEHSAKQLRARIEELERYKNVLGQYLSSDKALYLAALRTMMGILLCICTAGALLVLRSLKLSRFVEFSDFGQFSMGWFAFMFMLIGIVFVAAGARVTSLDSQNKVAETIAKVESEISVLKAKLEAKTR